jgi:hypothetical protein
MSRAPVVSFPNIQQAMYGFVFIILFLIFSECKNWLHNRDNFRLLKQHFDQTSRYVVLKHNLPVLSILQICEINENKINTRWRTVTHSFRGDNGRRDGHEHDFKGAFVYSYNFIQ